MFTPKWRGRLAILACVLFVMGIALGSGYISKQIGNTTVTIVPQPAPAPIFFPKPDDGTAALNKNFPLNVEVDSWNGFIAPEHDTFIGGKFIAANGSVTDNRTSVKKVGGPDYGVTLSLADDGFMFIDAEWLDGREQIVVDYEVAQTVRPFLSFTRIDEPGWQWVERFTFTTASGNKGQFDLGFKNEHGNGEPHYKLISLPNPSKVASFVSSYNAYDQLPWGTGKQWFAQHLAGDSSFADALAAYEPYGPFTQVNGGNIAVPIEGGFTEDGEPYTIYTHPTQTGLCIAVLGFHEYVKKGKLYTSPLNSGLSVSLQKGLTVKPC